MAQRFEVHAHTHFSNIRLLDCINKPEDLVNQAIELGLSGIAITDHESISSHPWISNKQQELIADGSTFKIAYGNEIYLTDTREMGQTYWHLIVIAKDAIGHRMMRELSSTAWLNGYFDRGMRRVPTLKSELKEMIERYGKGHLIFTSACLGGEVSAKLVKMIAAERANDAEGRKTFHREICTFMRFMIDIAEDDFYLEIAPGRSEEQLLVNDRMRSLAKAFNRKIVIGTDAHFLKKEDRWVHKAYLNSKNGDREIDSFYEYAYLQDENEIQENLSGLGYSYDELVAVSQEIFDKIEIINLFHKQQVPIAPVKHYPKRVTKSKYPTLDYMFQSDDEHDRYWVNECVNKLKEKNLCNHTYLSRLEEEADIQKHIGDRLETNMFAYPIFLQHYIDMFWECGSTVGAGRGSSCAGLNHWLLGVTQLDPIKYSLPYWRFLNKERVELPDIDIDICPSKRGEILDRIRAERGELGCVQVCTFGTETSRSAVQTACRGYRSDECPSGINSDISQYITSLLPSERGFVWSIQDTVYGNPEKDRKPVRQFIDEVNKYPGLLEIIVKVEGLIKQAGIHASGVIFPDGNNPYDMSAFMRAPDGTIVTQFSLHDQEFLGLTKYDFLVTEIQDMITQCVSMLQEHGFMDANLSLREAYNKYLHPDVLPINEDKLWAAMHNNSVLRCFQFDSQVGGQAMKKLKPTTPVEMANVNSVMRLMATEKGGETPADRYARMKSDMTRWYREMRNYGLTEEEQHVLEKYYLPEYGTPAQQESMMRILMDENICGFTLAESNTARKICAKKQMNKIPELKEKVLQSAKTYQLGQYVWDTAIMPQMGYSFSLIHALAYSFIGVQTAYLSTFFSPVFWNTAVLRVESGLDEDAGSKYDKIAKAVCGIASAGVNILPIDINKSQYAFEPDANNNAIVYGMKALNGVNGEAIAAIVENRPYSSLDDFLSKTAFNKTVNLSLIKSGAFDQFGDRESIMNEYLSKIGDTKTKVTLQNFKMVADKGLLPAELRPHISLFNFNKSLRANCKNGTNFILDDRHYNFFVNKFDADLLTPIDGSLGLSEKIWKKLYDKEMEAVKTYFKEHQEEILQKLNNSIVQELYDKYAQGSVSTWEMESMGYYWHQHELKLLDRRLYNVVEYNSLPEEAVVEKTFNDFPIYKLSTIAGTVIAKDDTKSTVSILTVNSGVVNVKMNREQYAYYNKRISEMLPNGEKKVLETSWFQRGTLLMFTGVRRNDTFFAKRYKKSESELVYKIDSIDERGIVKRTSERCD